MKPVLLHDRCALFNGDSGQLGSVLELNSIDAIVGDPPAGISFMGRKWDGDRGGRDQWIAWLAEVLAPAFAALKPGGHCLLWAIPRTSHWTAMAMESAGFEIRDVVMHLFGTGFPKGTDKSKIPVPGFNTALKPAAEHWILGRKPLIGTVAENMTTHGTGALNIGACRVGDEVRSVPIRPAEGGFYNIGSQNVEREPVIQDYEGRWPANVTLDEEAAAMLDEQSGERPGFKSNGNATRGATTDGAVTNMLRGAAIPRGDTGGASRFFYVAKAPRKEKDAGCDALPVKSGGEATDREEGSKGLSNPRAGAGRTGGARNHHPTVKSIALMRWLCRLITPPGGTVLDPFTGSGSTGVAALAEGFDFIGCEADTEHGYIDIAKARLEHALKGTP